MKLERYCETHAPELQRLLAQHGMPAVAVPKIGFAVIQGRRAAAMGFLREVEGGSYMFDGLISDPKLNSEQRHQAMSLLWDKIINEANGAPILGFSLNNGTVNRALASGFEAIAYTVLVHKG
jgi:hypothetical protein